MKLTILAGGAVAAAAWAGATLAEDGESWPAEFSGRTFEIVTGSGATNVVTLAPDGALTVIPKLGADVATGRWTSRDGVLCTRFVPRGTECWDPATVVAANGERVTVRSDRGQDLRIRLLNGAGEELVDGSG